MRVAACTRMAGGGALLAANVLAAAATTPPLDLRGAQPIDLAAVRRAAAYSKAHRGVSFLALQNGKTLLDEDAGSARRIYSGTKAFWGLAALAAAQDGILNLDEPVAQTIGAWRNDARKSHVTVRQLLDFSSAIEPAFYIQNTQNVDRTAVALSRPLLGEPGNVFTYGPAALQVFHEVLKTKLHGERPTHFLERRVLGRLGLGPERYLPDRAGNPLLATGFTLSPRQWARLGEVVLRGGSPVISSASLAQCWRGSPANPAFAFGWWNNRAAPAGREVDIERMLDRPMLQQEWSGVCICRDAPSDLVCCIGSLGQRLYVIPSLSVIVVRQADGGSFSDSAFLRLLLGRPG